MATLMTRNACASLAMLAAMVLCPATLRAQQRVDKQGSGAIVSGTGGLPDLARGKAAAAAGRSADAEHDLLPLAERGYIDAALALGHLYAHQQTAEATHKAIRWFRFALPQTPFAEVPLARALLHQDDVKQLAEAESLFDHAWDDREDVDALAGLIELYSGHPAFDRKRRAAALVAEAEALDQPIATAAVIRWYRSTQNIKGHGERLLALCRKSLDLAPDCYVDLVRDARMKGDKNAMRKLTVAMMSQFGQQRVPFNVAASMARALVATPDNSDEPQMAPVAVSDVPETDAQELVSTASVGGVSGAVSAIRTCAQDPVGVVAPAPAPVVAATPGMPAQPVKPAPEPPPAAANAEPDLANQIIKKLVAGSAEAQVEAAGAVVRYPFLAPDFEVEPALQSGRKQGVADATLFLGELHLYGQRAARDPKASLQYLQEAAQNPATAIEGRYFLGRLYQYGYLDEVDPQQAQAHLLSAARDGYIPADGALARLYASAKGLCANRVYAYVFAQLGVRGGTDAMRTLRDQLHAALSPQERATAEQLLRQELAARPQSEQAPGLAQADTSGGHP
jgi:TPR repeat protein